MGAYIYKLKGAKYCIKVNINGTIHSIALLAFHYKPISTWDGEPRWQRLAKARCERMKNVWVNNGGMPKYVCHVFIPDNGRIDFENAEVFEWPYREDASICDESVAFFKRVHVGTLKHEYHNVWEMNH